jgi:hypothetical protein
MDHSANTSQEDYSRKDKVYMTKITVKLSAGVGGFVEDKDEAKRIRNDTLLPALVAHKHVILDFADVKYSTQSFIHALLGAVLQQYREPALQQLEFKNCGPQIKSLIQLVVDYSLGGFKEPVSSHKKQSTKASSHARSPEITKKTAKQLG